MNQNESLVIPLALIKTTSNDADLGAIIREMYWQAINNPHTVDN